MAVGALGLFRSRQQGRVRVVPATSEHVTALRRLVAAEPARHVHVASCLDKVRRPGSARLFAILDGARLAGGLQSQRGFSWALAPSARGREPIYDAIAHFIASRAAAAEILVGAEDEVEAIIERLDARGPWPQELRRQLMMAAGEAFPAAGAAELEGLEFRLAGMRDLAFLLDAHAAMCQEDLGVDQVARHRSAYEHYFRELIGSGHVFVGALEGELVFKAEVALTSGRAWLVEGVYTYPELRRRGIAREGMAQIVREAGREGRRACLYVHRRNEGAIRVYERVGFEAVCSWLTVVTTRDRGRSQRLDML